MEANLRRVTEEVHKLAGLRGIERVMGAIMKGALGAAVMVWNNEMKRSAVVDYMRYQGKNEAKKAALRQVQLILGGILKGEQYVALDGWKRHFAQYKLHSLQGLMTNDQATLQKNFALQHGVGHLVPAHPFDPRR